MEADNGTGKEFEVETGIGKLRAKGYHLGNVLQIVAAVLLALMAMMMYEMRAETKATAATLTTATKDAVKDLAVSTKLEHDMLAKAIDKSTEQQEITNYIFTLSPEDRARLRLQMPDGLRRRMIDR